MLLNKADCIFTILPHDKFQNTTISSKKILMETSVEGAKYEYEYTNGGFMINNGASYFCAKKFTKRQAKEFIEKLPEKFLV